MNKLTNILLGAILAIGLGILIVSLQPRVQDITVVPPDVTTTLGQAGYNELGQKTMTHATVSVGIETGVTTSLTVYKIFSANQGRMYAEINNSGGNEVRLWFGTTTYTSGATTTYASSTKYWATGRTLAATSTFTIGPDNLWQGEVWGIATSSTSTIRTIEK